MFTLRQGGKADKQMECGSYLVRGRTLSNVYDIWYIWPNPGEIVLIASTEEIIRRNW